MSTRDSRSFRSAHRTARGVAAAVPVAVVPVVSRVIVDNPRAVDETTVANLSLIHHRRGCDRFVAASSFLVALVLAFARPAGGDEVLLVRPVESPRDKLSPSVRPRVPRARAARAAAAAAETREILRLLERRAGRLRPTVVPALAVGPVERSNPSNRSNPSRDRTRRTARRRTTPVANRTTKPPAGFRTSPRSTLPTIPMDPIDRHRSRVAANPSRIRRRWPPRRRRARAGVDRPTRRTEPTSPPRPRRSRLRPKPPRRRPPSHPHARRRRLSRRTRRRKNPRRRRRRRLRTRRRRDRRHPR